MIEEPENEKRKRLFEVTRRENLFLVGSFLVARNRS
jgi:hypothetical protein